jgi:hypothetical protein
VKPHGKLWLVLPLLLLAGAAAAWAARRPRPKADPCLPDRREVVVVTADRALWLCEAGHGGARFRVAIGSGGVDKRSTGDRRTPLGTYPLGAPRPSSRFGTFIPVGYPTEEQKKLGFTGSDIGIHGPDRRLRWAGAINAWYDWTAGCIAVATDDEIGQVARFVSGGAATVSIR